MNKKPTSSLSTRFGSKHQTGNSRKGELKMKLRPSFLFALLLIVVYTNIGLAQDSLNVSLLSKTELCWDHVKDGAIKGHYAYLASGATGIRIFDITNAANPVEVGVIEGNYNSVHFYNDTQLMTCDDDNHVFEILTLVDPAYPDSVELYSSVQLNNLSYRIEIVDIRIHRNYAILHGNFSNLYLVNISQLLNPVFYGELSNPDNLIDYDISGDLLTASICGGGLAIYEFSNPLNPVQLSFFDLDGHAVKVVGDYAYVSIQNFGTTPDSIYVVDISDPYMPERYGAISNRFIEHFSLLNDTFLVASRISSIDILNISNILPSLVSNINVTSYKTFVADTRLLSVHVRRSHFIDISSPTEPEVLSSIEEYAELHSIDTYDNFVYISSSVGLIVYDITDEMNPVFVDCVPGFMCNPITISDSFLFKIDDRQIEIFSLASPTDPQLIGVAPLNGSVYDFTISGHCLYVMYTHEGNIASFDISDPTNPRFIESFETPETTKNIEMALDKLVTISHVNHSLLVDSLIIRCYDTHTIENLTQSGYSEVTTLNPFIATLGYNVSAHNTEENTFMTFDAGNGPLITETGSCQTDYSYIDDMDQYGNYIFTCSSGRNSNNIEIFDVYDSNNPLSIGYYKFNKEIKSLRVKSGPIFSIDDHYLYAMEYDLPEPPSRFKLTYPIDGQEFVANSLEDIVFRWNNSANTDPLTEYFTFGLYAYCEDLIDTLFTNSFIESDSLSINIWNHLGIENIDNTINFSWWVQAERNNLKMDCEDAGRFHIVPVSKVNPPVDNNLPSAFEICSVYPNPFNSVVNVVYSVPQTTDMLIEIFNINGQQVGRIAHKDLTKGSHRFVWEAYQTAGIYFLRLSSDTGWQQTKKLVFLK